ncbi:FkbM family methyltransferase [Sphingomonas sp.]|uniref:FkbM family methyltransferase n=1 Tax=Sphingomonas sp. TaxID=28214 RepID=UPI00286BB98F|nr:FkbM family methyltransferase [Sphingomonas sp.]
MNLVVYGLGSTGRLIVDELLDAGVAIDLILDRGKAGQMYRDIPVRALGEADVTGAKVLISLHNHYVDLHQLNADLTAAGAADILTPIRLAEFIDQPKSNNGYWLDPSFSYDARSANLARARSLLADPKSRELFDALLRYRRGGVIADCPIPSLDDEYTPADLPRFAEPLRLIDCGAFTGVAIHKLLTANYAIASLVAFEPDLANFAILASRSFPVDTALCLPLGTWSSTTQLKFSSGSSMASHLSDSGDVTIQCVAIDDVLHGEPINLVKLDVEGAEIDTLKGMEQLIREQRPNLLVSAYHTPGHLHEIAELIDDWKLGYRFHLRVHEQNSFGVVLYALQDELLEN